MSPPKELVDRKLEKYLAHRLNLRGENVWLTEARHDGRLKTDIITTWPKHYPLTEATSNTIIQVTGAERVTSEKVKAFTKNHSKLRPSFRADQQRAQSDSVVFAYTGELEDIPDSTPDSLELWDITEIAQETSQWFPVDEEDLLNDDPLKKDTINEIPASLVDAWFMESKHLLEGNPVRNLTGGVIPVGKEFKGCTFDLLDLRSGEVVIADATVGPSGNIRHPSPFPTKGRVRLRLTGLPRSVNQPWA